MSQQHQSPDEWWGGLSPTARAFFREVLGLAEDLLENEVIRLTFSGRNYSSVLVSGRTVAVPLGRGRGLRGGPLSEVDEWWEELSLEDRGFVRALAGIIVGLEQHPDECLEIKNTGDGFRVAHLLNLKGPIGGKAERN
ncbi:MAG TPA: hypothetical protein VG167_17885 [Verrucomicrobiae bacterium]|nr:hypothetical protein [Verrucomicrobiae bacterium]